MDPLGFGFDTFVSPVCLFTFSSPPSSALLAPVSLEVLQRLLHSVDSAPGWLCWLHSWVANFIEVIINLILPLLLYEHKIC